MPLYEYTCIDCGTEFEELVSGADAKIVCAECKSENVTRKFSTFASSAFSGKSSCGTCKPSSGFS